MPNFEIKDKDLAARIGTLQTPHGKIETPALLPVVNPNKLVIEPREMEEIGAQAIITNAYILRKTSLHEVITKGVHDFLDFKGPIMTDSGAYQLMEYGEIPISNKKVLDFQDKINSDIRVILDVPTAKGDKEKVKEAVEETIKRLEEGEEHSQDKEALYAGPVQGWRYSELFKKCTREEKNLDYDIHAIGSVVPTMKNYNYSDLVEPMAIAKEELPEDRPIHLFGAGHPMVLPFAVAMGMDLFDSAAYSLYAEDGRYLTSTGTKRIEDIYYLPCRCPVCVNNSPKDLEDEKEKLAKHNLHVTFKEMDKIKQAIKDKSLFELLESRCRAHPRLKELMDTIMKNTKTIKSRDPLAKKHLFKVSEYSEERPDYQRALKKAEEIEGTEVNTSEFGKVPKRILQCYPYSHTGEEINYSEASYLERVKGASEYWLGTDIVPDDVEIVKSPKTGRIRRVKKDEDLFAVIRATDFMFLLHHGAKKLHKETDYPKKRLVMDDEAKEFVEKGRSVFNKFVVDLDPDLSPREPVLIVDEEDNLLAAGETYLSSQEILDFDRGEAAKNRWSVK